MVCPVGVLAPAKIYVWFFGFISLKRIRTAPNKQRNMLHHHVTMWHSNTRRLKPIFAAIAIIIVVCFGLVSSDVISG